MFESSVGNSGESNITRSSLAHLKGDNKKLITRFKPSYKKADSDDPYEPVIHPSIPILNRDDGMSRASEEDTISVKAAMIFKGKRLPTKSYVDETERYVNKFGDSIKRFSDLARNVEERWHTFKRTNQQENLELEKLRKSEIPEIQMYAECLYRKSQKKESALKEEMRLVLRAEAALEGIALNLIGN
ncbi:hypothetical protein I302_102818 [Kwoniella bestiolae CBS 10118]|uniref:Uncharacterized protein n=1 Tax=Kwoniella bestiolae CBS 10118 TaxID=1296100 RepID=A0A1B9GG45_9TREE|nr:hypothetical protein I302_01513 [Kwoniella bestiolae CBS 10118]OCF29996.1 hypothetical protein I302_01513 [Kwoniella bestiolae CBS 10118]